MSLPVYASYSHSGFDWLGVIPGHWKALPNKVAFGRVKIEVGDEWSDTQLLSLTLRGVVSRDIDSGDGKYPADFSNYQFVEPNDLVMCLFDMDETPRTVGLSRMHGMITSAYTVFRCNPAADPAFVCYFYRHVDSHKGLRPFYTGLRKTVRVPKFLSIKMPIPPLDEQEAISSFLDAETSKIDALVSEQRRLIELLKEKRQAVISHAVTKGLNPNAPMKPSGIQWLGDVPQHWVVKRYKHLLRIQQGMAFKSSDYVGNSTVVSVRMGNIKKGGEIDLLHNTKYLPDSFAIKYVDYQLSDGDLLIAMTDMSPSLEFLAVPAFMKNLDCDVTYLLNQRVGRIIVGDTCESGYLKYLLLSQSLREQLKATGLGTVQANMSNGDLYRTSLAIPPSKEEQAEIVRHLDDVTAGIDALVAQAERAIELLKERRTALISAAVTGKIDVRGWEERRTA